MQSIADLEAAAAVQRLLKSYNPGRERMQIVQASFPSPQHQLSVLQVMRFMEIHLAKKGRAKARRVH